MKRLAFIFTLSQSTTCLTRLVLGFKIRGEIIRSFHLPWNLTSDVTPKKPKPRTMLCLWESSLEWLQKQTFHKTRTMYASRNCFSFSLSTALNLHNYSSLGMLKYTSFYSGIPSTSSKCLQILDCFY